MTAELIHTRTGDVALFKRDEFPSGHYKLLIPKGTQRWWGVTVAWRSEQPSNAWMAMDAPPVRVGEPMADSSDAMERLWAGETLHAHGIPYSQILSMSQPKAATAWRADRDRWLYIDVEFAEGRAQQWDSQIELDPAYAQPPAAPALPEPDLALAQRTLAYAHQAGLVAALMKTSGAHDDEQLIDWMTQQGDLWFAICRLAGAAEKGRA